MPADDYTPTTEQVRRAYTTGMRQAFIASAGAHSSEFDRWLAAHDARVKAEALRDAAQNMDEWNVEAIVVTGEEDDEDTWQEWTVADWLTDRADTIEKEAGA